MNISELFDIRRKALKLLVEKATNGNVAKFARENQLDATYIRQLLNGDRTFGEKSARNLEDQCGLTEFYFDMPHHDKIGTIWALLRQLEEDDLWEVQKSVEVKIEKQTRK